MKTTFPINEQVRAYIYEKIRSGAWKPDEQIPSERDLSEQFGVSRNTIRQALMKLEGEGLLSRAQGHGTFVCIPKIDMVEGELISITTLMHKQGRNPETVLTRFSREILNLQDAQELGYPVGEAAYIIQRLRRADGVNVVLENTRLPCRKVPGFDQYDLVNSSVFAIMAEVYNYRELFVHQTIEAGSASDEVAELLGVRPASPVIIVNRFTRDKSNELVERAQDFYPANRIRFVYENKINLGESQQKFLGPSMPKMVPAGPEIPD